MKIEIRFTSDEARRIEYFLRKKYQSKAQLKTLVKITVLRAVSEQAQKELDAVEKGIE